MDLDSIIRFRILVKKAQSIRDSDATWEVKYDLIFGELSKRLRDFGVPDYADPDIINYNLEDNQAYAKEAVLTYVSTLENKLEEFGALGMMD